MQKIRRYLGSRLTNQFATLLAGRIIAAGVQGVSIYLLARWSIISDFGVISAALGIAVTLQALGDGGATTFIVRETALKGANRKVAHAEQFSRLLISTIAITSAITIVTFSAISSKDYLSLLPLSAWIALDRSSDLRSAIARGQGDVWLGTINLVIRRIAHLIAFIVAHYFDANTTLAYTFSLMFGSSLALIAMNNRLPKPPCTPFGVRTIFHAYVRCRPYWIHSVTIQLRNLDTLIVAGISGTVQAAYYGVGARLMTPLRMVPATLATALLPHLVRRGDLGNRDIAAGLLASALISLPYIALIPVSAHVVPYLGTGFEGATIPLQIMLLGLAGTSFISLFNALLQARGKAKEVARISTTTALLLLLLVLLGTLTYGSIGASIGFSAATLIQAVMTYQKAKEDA